jgi:hypothetical protein
VAGAAGSADNVFLQAFDGRAYSGWNSFVHVATNTAPVVTATPANVRASAGQPLQVASMFSAGDDLRAAQDDRETINALIAANTMFAAGRGGHFTA